MKSDNRLGNSNDLTRDSNHLVSVYDLNFALIRPMAIFAYG